MVIVLAASGCGGAHRRSPQPVVPVREWHAVINDWEDNGRITQPHSCGSVVVAVGALTRFSSPATFTDVVHALDRYAGTVCTHHPQLDRIEVGMTNGQVAAIAGMPRTPGPNCWLYPVTSRHDGRRVCFTNGRATLVQISVHG